MNSLKPIKRSSFRIFLGKKAYRLKRYTEWVFDEKKYAKLQFAFGNCCITGERKSTL
ncbi:MAG TPA: hypothetical protein VLQ66_00525 [Paenisporosarcina sp.]|nr:hypothetical protein [Paenisporosarcina sp.]